MMANGSIEGVFVLLVAAAFGLVSVQGALVVGARRASRRTERIVGALPAHLRAADDVASKPP